MPYALPGCDQSEVIYFPAKLNFNLYITSENFPFHGSKLKLMNLLNKYNKLFIHLTLQKFMLWINDLLSAYRNNWVKLKSDGCIFYLVRTYEVIYFADPSTNKFPLSTGFTLNTGIFWTTEFLAELKAARTVFAISDEVNSESVLLITSSGFQLLMLG